MDDACDDHEMDREALLSLSHDETQGNKTRDTTSCTSFPREPEETDIIFTRFFTRKMYKEMVRKESWHEDNVSSSKEDKGNDG